MDNYRELRKQILEWGIENRKQWEIINKKMDDTLLLIKKMKERNNIVDDVKTETTPPSKSVYYWNPDSEPE